MTRGKRLRPLCRHPDMLAQLGPCQFARKGRIPELVPLNVTGTQASRFDLSGNNRPQVGKYSSG